MTQSQRNELTYMSDEDVVETMYNMSVVILSLREEVIILSKRLSNVELTVKEPAAVSKRMTH